MKKLISLTLLLSCSTIPLPSVSKSLPVVSPKKVKIPKKKFEKFIIPQNLGKDAALGTDANDFDLAIGATTQPTEAEKKEGSLKLFYNCRAESNFVWAEHEDEDYRLAQLGALRECYRISPTGSICELMGCKLKFVM